jgi:hypothetical protein
MNWTLNYGNPVTPTSQKFSIYIQGAEITQLKDKETSIAFPYINSLPLMKNIIAH